MAGLSLAGRLDEILEGVDLALWAECLSEAELVAALGRIDDLGDAGRTEPPPSLILEPLRYGGPGDFDVVILGQDPFPRDAQGLCFSVPSGTAIPQSLVRIFGCLGHSGLRGPHAGVRDSGDLRPWAVQGVLMINTAWTTRGGARRSHAAPWKKFTGGFVRRLCAARQAAGRRLHFLLWGGDARAFAGVARRYGHLAAEWSHPSPMADNALPAEARFLACPHFEEANAERVAAGLRPICWDNLAPVVAFSDGTSDLAGEKGAKATTQSRAGFAAVLVGAQFGSAVIRGEVAPALYAFADAGAPERGVQASGAPAPPTNNRGELLGLIYCFLALLRGRALGRVEVVSDSKISVDTLLDFLPRRLQKGTEKELKNFDLVWIAWCLLERLRSQAATVILTHVRSHQKPPPPSASPRERFLHKGNAKADREAAEALKGEGRCAVEVLEAPYVLRGLARAGSRPIEEAAPAREPSGEAP